MVKYRGIGFLEMVGGLGLVLPWLLNIAPISTPLAAPGLVITMIGAAIVHVRRNEVVPMVAVNVVIGAIAAFIAIGRFGDLRVETSEDGRRHLRQGTPDRALEDHMTEEG